MLISYGASAMSSLLRLIFLGSVVEPKADRPSEEEHVRKHKLEKSESAISSIVDQPFYPGRSSEEPKTWEDFLCFLYFEDV